MSFLTEKTAIITGGGRSVLEDGQCGSIGYGIATAYAKEGANLVLTGRNLQKLTEAKEELETKYQIKVLAIQADVNENADNEAVITSVVQQAADTFGRIDVLINNAGFETHSAIENAEEDSMDAIYNVNTKSPYFLLQKLLPALKKAGRASVINVTSIHQKVPVRENGYYCMAKASLGMFTKVAALELAKYGIRVNNLAPGAILTDMNRELVEAMDFEQWIPIGRVGRADELIGPAVFLASDASSYVTGTTLYVDGGYSENLLRY